MAARLPAVEETILKRKKRIDAAQARQARANLRGIKPKRGTPRLTFKRAEKFVKEFRLRQRDETRLARQARWQRNDVETVADAKSKLAFAVRIRKVASMTPQSMRALKLLRLDRIYSGCFLKLNTTTLSLLRVAEPYITWGYPSLKSVRELLYKHGHGSVDGRRTALTSNADIEKVLGHLDIICLEDIVHQVVTIGPHFKDVNTFLLLFRLNPPAGGWKRRSKLFAVGGECGPRGDKIDELLRRMI